MMPNHYHPPRCKNPLYISDEWIRHLACNIVSRAEKKVLSETRQVSDLKKHRLLTGASVTIF